MAHTYNLNYIHCVFSTKRRLPLITDPEKVWNTMRKVAAAEKIQLFAVGGMPDHVHLLVSIPATRAVSDMRTRLEMQFFSPNTPMESAVLMAKRICLD